MNEPIQLEGLPDRSVWDTGRSLYHGKGHPMSSLTVKTCDGQMVDLSKPENLRRGMTFDVAAVGTCADPAYSRRRITISEFPSENVTLLIDAFGVVTWLPSVTSLYDAKTKFLGMDRRHSTTEDIERYCCGSVDPNYLLMRNCTLAIGDHSEHKDIATGATWPARTNTVPAEAEVLAALDVCARAIAHDPSSIRAMRALLDRIAATSVERLVDSARSGLYVEEAHTLRNIVQEAGDAGLPMQDSPALRSLVKRGLVTAYMPTLLGAVVDKLVYDTQEIPVLGNMPTSFADELLANAESVFGHLWASERKPSGTKVRIGGKVRDVGPLTPQEAERVLGNVAEANVVWRPHSVECPTPDACKCATGFQWTTGLSKPECGSPPESAMSGIAAAIAAVPVGCDAGGWANVVRAIAADHYEQRSQGPRDINGWRDHLPHARRLVPLYAGLRRDGYSAQSSVRMLLRDTPPEGVSSETWGHVIRNYCEAYEAAR